MASVEIHPDRMVIRLSAAEKALALRRSDVVLARAAITSTLITDDPWVWPRGVRAPGVRLPGSLAVGVWRGPGGRDFVLARRGRPAVVLDLDPAITAQQPASDEFDDFVRVVLSTRHAAELVRALRGDDSGAVFDAGA